MSTVPKNLVVYALDSTDKMPDFVTLQNGVTCIPSQSEPQFIILKFTLKCCSETRDITRRK